MYPQTTSLFRLKKQNKMSKGILALLLVLVTLFDLKSQTILISGFITDKSTSKPIKLASVSIVGRNNMAVSDDEGTFTLSLSSVGKGDIITIRVSKIGYQPYTIKTSVSGVPMLIKLTQINKKSQLRQSQKRTPPNTLFVTKVLDFKKIIRLYIGGNISFLKYKDSTEIPELMNFSDDDEFFKLRFEDGSLKIWCDVPGFDSKFVAKIRNNKLITGNSFNVNSSDRYFEVFDDYNIPILQIELIHSSNSIVVRGVQHVDYGFIVYTGEKTFMFQYRKVKSKMTPPELNESLNEYQTTAKKYLFPLHE